MLRPTLGALAAWASYLRDAGRDADSVGRRTAQPGDYRNSRNAVTAVADPNLPRHLPARVRRMDRSAIVLYLAAAAPPMTPFSTRLFPAKTFIRPATEAWGVRDMPVKGSNSLLVGSIPTRGRPR